MMAAAEAPSTRLSIRRSPIMEISIDNEEEHDDYCGQRQETPRGHSNVKHLDDEECPAKPQYQDENRDISNDASYDDEIPEGFRSLHNRLLLNISDVDLSPTNLELNGLDSSCSDADENDGDDENAITTSLQEQVQRLEQLDEAFSEMLGDQEDGLQEEVFTLTYSQEWLRQEMAVVDMICSPAMSPWSNNCSEHDAKSVFDFAQIEDMMEEFSKRQQQEIVDRRELAAQKYQHSLMVEEQRRTTRQRSQDCYDDEDDDDSDISENKLLYGQLSSPRVSSCDLVLHCKTSISRESSNRDLVLHSKTSISRESSTELVYTEVVYQDSRDDVHDDEDCSYYTFPKSTMSASSSCSTLNQNSTSRHQYSHDFVKPALTVETQLAPDMNISCTPAVHARRTALLSPNDDDDEDSEFSYGYRLRRPSDLSISASSPTSGPDCYYGNPYPQSTTACGGTAASGGRPPMSMSCHSQRSTASPFSLYSPRKAFMNCGSATAQSPLAIQARPSGSPRSSPRGWGKIDFLWKNNHKTPSPQNSTPSRRRSREINLCGRGTPGSPRISLSSSPRMSPSAKPMSSSSIVASAQELATRMNPAAILSQSATTTSAFLAAAACGNSSGMLLVVAASPSPRHKSPRNSNAVFDFCSNGGGCQAAYQGIQEQVLDQWLAESASESDCDFEEEESGWLAEIHRNRLPTISEGGSSMATSKLSSQASASAATLPSAPIMEEDEADIFSGLETMPTIATLAQVDENEDTNKEVDGEDKVAYEMTPFYEDIFEHCQSSLSKEATHGTCSSVTPNTVIPIDDLVDHLNAAELHDSPNHSVENDKEGESILGETESSTLHSSYEINNGDRIGSTISAAVWDEDLSSLGNDREISQGEDHVQRTAGTVVGAKQETTARRMHQEEESTEESIQSQEVMLENRDLSLPKMMVALLEDSHDELEDLLTLFNEATTSNVGEPCIVNTKVDNISVASPSIRTTMSSTSSSRREPPCPERLSPRRALDLQSEIGRHSQDYGEIVTSPSRHTYESISPLPSGSIACPSLDDPHCLPHDRHETAPDSTMSLVESLLRENPLDEDPLNEELVSQNGEREFEQFPIIVVKLDDIMGETESRHASFDHEIVIDLTNHSNDEEDHKSKNQLIDLTEYSERNPDMAAIDLKSPPYPTLERCSSSPIIDSSPEHDKQSVKLLMAGVDSEQQNNTTSIVSSMPVDNVSPPDAIFDLIDYHSGIAVLETMTPHDAIQTLVREVAAALRGEEDGGPLEMDDSILNVLVRLFVRSYLEPYQRLEAFQTIRESLSDPGRADECVEESMERIARRIIAQLLQDAEGDILFPHQQSQMVSKPMADKDAYHHHFEGGFCGSFKECVNWYQELIGAIFAGEPNYCSFDGASWDHPIDLCANDLPPMED